MSVMQRSSVQGLSGRALRASTSRRPVVCRAESATEAPAASKAAAPEWLPAQAVPVLEFFTKDDFSLKDSSVYQTYLKKYVEDEWVVKSTGFKSLPETINGRSAMLGFVAGVSAEILGAPSLLAQTASAPQIVLIVMALITAGSVIPIVKGTKGDYLASLRDTYSLPEGVFTEVLEKVHGRVAMLGLGALLAIELVKGSALF